MDTDCLYRADADTCATTRACIRTYLGAAQTVTLNGLIPAAALTGNAKYAGIGKTTGMGDFRNPDYNTFFVN